MKCTLVILSCFIFLFQERFAKLKEMANASCLAKKAALNATFDKSTVLNQTYDKNENSQLNSTYTKPADQTTQSYDITPARHELPPGKFLIQNLSTRWQLCIVMTVVEFYSEASEIS